MGFNSRLVVVCSFEEIRTYHKQELIFYHDLDLKGPRKSKFYRDTNPVCSFVSEAGDREKRLNLERSRVDTLGVADELRGSLAIAQSQKIDR